MSKSIDERVVSMKFDNKKFEENIQESISSLNKLDETVNKFDSENTFLDFENGLSRTEAVFFGFYQTIGGYLADLTMKAASFVKSMSLDQVTAGFDKYTSETKAAQAIVANTDATVEETYAAIDRLAEYTDATSYDFSNLTDTMTNFAMAGVKLEDAEEAVKGIGNWAALSGAGVGEANIAMNALVKSMSSGSMQLQEWNTITKSAKMGTRNFTEELIRTARETSAAFREFEAVNGAVTFENFRENAFKTNHLITSDVLLATLKKYGDATGDLGAEALAAASEAKTFGEALGAVKDAVSGGWSKNFRYLFGNYEEARKFWTFVQDAMLEIFTLGQAFTNEVLEKWHVSEVGGWADAFDALKYAWEGITNLAKPVADAFQKVFNFNVGDSVKKLNDLTIGFKESTAAFALFTGAWQNEDVINEKLQSLQFPKIKNDNPELLTGKEDYAEDLATIQKSKKLYGNLNDMFSGLFSVLNLGKTIIGSFAKGLKEALQFLKPLGKLVLEIGGFIGRLTTKIVEAVQKSGIFEAIFTSIGKLFGGTLKKAVEVISELFGKLFGSIEGSKAFSTLESILRTIGQVFEWISDKLLNKLVIPAFNLFSEAISAVIGFVSPLKKKLEDAGTAASGFWDNFKETKLVGLSDSFSKVLDSISGFLSEIGSKIKGAFSSNEEVEGATSIFETLLGIIEQIAEFIVNNLTAAFDWLSGKIDTLKGHLEPLTGVLNTVKEAFKQFFAQFKKGEEDGSVGIIETIGNVITGVVSGILDILTKAVGWLKTTFSGLDIQGILSVILDLLRGFVLLELGSFISSLKGIAEGITGLLQPFKQTKEVTKYIKDLAISLVLLAVGIKMLSGIETDKLANGLVVVEALLISLVEAVQLLNSNGSLSVSGIKTGNSISILSPTFQTQMIDIAAGILILAAALSKLSKLSWGDLIKGAVGLGAIMLEFGFFTAMLDGVNLEKCAKQVKSLATAITILSVALKIISTIPFWTMMGALVGFTVVLGELTLAVMLLDKQDLTKTGVGMIALSAAVLVMAAALKVLASINFLSLMGSVLALTIVLAELVAVMLLTNGTITSGIGVLIMVEALALLIPVLLALSAIPFTTILVGLGALAAIFVVFAAGGALMNMVAPGLLIFGLALDAIAASVLILGLGLQALSLGLVGLGTAILVFGQVILDNGDILTAAFKSVLGGLILVFDELLPDLIAAIIKFLLEGTVALFDWLDSEIDTIISRLVLLLIRTIESLAAAIETNKEPLDKAIGDLLMAIIHTIAEFLRDIFNRIFEFFGIQKVETGHWFTDLLGIISTALVNIIGAVVTALAGILTKVIEFIVLAPLYIAKFFLELFGINTEGLDDMIQSVKDFFKNAWENLKAELKKIWDKVTGWFTDLWGKIKGIFKGKDKDTGDLAEAAKEGMEDVTDAMGDSIEEGGKEVEEAALNVSKDTVTAFDQDGDAEKEVKEEAEDILESFSNPFNSGSDGAKSLLGDVGDLSGNVIDKLGLDGKGDDEAYDTGAQFSTGFSNGIVGGQNGVWNAASSIGQTALKALRQTLDVKSPSRIARQIGDFLGVGFSLGINDSALEAVSSAEDLGNNTIAVLKDALSGVDFATEEVTDPVIKPVLDLSEIQNGSNSIQNMLGGDYSIGAFLSSITGARSPNAVSGGNQNTTINMTVNGAAGQDVESLADIVTRKLNQQLRSKERVWA